MNQIHEGTIADLKFDQRNANTGTEFGNHLLRKSIETLGVGRGIVAAADGTIIGGNHVTEMLGELGIDKVIFVPTEGNTLVVTQRMDIEPGTKAFHELALADNKVGQLNLHFDETVLADLSAQLEIDITDWGFKQVTIAAEEEQPNTIPKVKEEVASFRLDDDDTAELDKALQTAMLENDIDDGDRDARERALMVIIREYLQVRS